MNQWFFLPSSVLASYITSLPKGVHMLSWFHCCSSSGTGLVHTFVALTCACNESRRHISCCCCAQQHWLLAAVGWIHANSTCTLPPLVTKTHCGEYKTISAEFPPKWAAIKSQQSDPARHRTANSGCPVLVSRHRYFVATEPSLRGGAVVVLVPLYCLTNRGWSNRQFSAGDRR